MRTQERNAWHRLADTLRGRREQNRPTACFDCVKLEPAHRIDNGLCPACKAHRVHGFRRQLRNIEMALGTLSTRNPDDITEIRKLTYDHSRYREALLTHGVDHPVPVIHW